MPRWLPSPKTKSTLSRFRRPTAAVVVAIRPRPLRTRSNVPLDRVLFFGALLALACAMAYRTPGRDRRDARLCAVLLTIGWALYVTSWARMAPVHLLYLSTGITLQAQEMWAIVDCCTGVIIAGMWSLRGGSWRWALALLLLIQSGLHVFNPAVTPTYTHILDVLWLLQLVCLVSAGRYYDPNWLPNSDWRNVFRGYDRARRAVRKETAS